MSEHLAHFTLKDGSTVDMRRQDYDVQICRQDHCATIPKASARQALEFFALLESLAERVDLPEEIEGE